MRNNVIVGYTNKPPQNGLKYLLIIAIILAFIGYAYWSESNQGQTNTSSSTTTTNKTSSSTLKPTTSTSTTSTTTTTLKAVSQKSNDKVRTSDETKIIAYQLGIELADGNLSDPMDNFSMPTRVYLHNTIRSAHVPNHLKHVWITPKGAIKAEIPLVMSNTEGDTWSYVTISDNIDFKGKWTVKVLDSSDKVLLEKTFQVN